MEKATNTLSAWAKKLKELNIKFTENKEELRAKLDKRSGEGHHWLELSIAFNQSGEFIGSITGMGLGSQMIGITPDKAISKFLAYKSAIFS